MARVIGSLFFHSIEGSEGLSTQQQQQQLEQQQPSLAYVHAFNVTGDEVGEQHPEEEINVQVEVVAVFGAIFVAAAVILAVTLYVSKLRKRQNLTNCDIEVMDTTDANISKEIQQCYESEFDEYKPSVWRKTFRSVLLRLRGQEQHKDVYVIPSHLREQLKQTYVY